MSCNCNGLGLSCSREELQECAIEQCNERDEGRLLNSMWQSYDSARTCAENWTARTGVPHRIAVYHRNCTDVVPVVYDEYRLVSCPLDRVYDDWFDWLDTPDFSSGNYHRARTCAEQWNRLSGAQGSPIRYEARRIASRFWFTDVWQVLEREN